jgi:hypothetical protein
MDPLLDRVDALARQLNTLQQQTHTVTRQLRWWRGLACGLVGLAVLAWALPVSLAQDEDAQEQGQTGLAQRVAALEDLLKHFSREDNEITITGANLHLVNGLGQTACESEEEPIPDCPNGLGNLIVGYNESRARFGLEDIRTGSHNVVVRQRHNFSRFGGLVVGTLNTISGDFASVSGGGRDPFGQDGFEGAGNRASGILSVVSGGQGNTASGFTGSVSGGDRNTASGFAAVVSGGAVNTASGAAAVVSGGGRDPLIGEGAGNTASGFFSVVSGGRNRTAEGEFD